MSGPLGSSQWMYQAGEDFTIDQSLRFAPTRDTVLTRTPASTGNRRTFTVSAWVKRGIIGVNSAIFGTTETGAAGDAGEDNWRLKFDSGDAIGVYTDGTVQFALESTAKFRDPSAWYHVVCAVDTTQGTETDRFKLYVNGTQITVFGVSNYPAQNLDTAVNYTHEHRVGTSYSTEDMDGYIAEMHFIDGTALTPT